MRRRRLSRPLALWVCTLLVATAAAGCLGGPTGQDEPLQRAPEATPDVGPTVPPKTPPRPFPASPPGDATQRGAFRFPLDAPFHRIEWHNGSFAPQETGLGGGFITGAFAKQVDLSALLPPDVPTRVAVTIALDAKTVPVVGPTGRADPTSNGTTWYSSSWRAPEPGRYVLQATLMRNDTGTFGIALEAYAPDAETPPEVAYSIRVDATADPERIPLGVPVALRAGADETLRFETPPGEDVELLVFGDDDRLLDRLYVRDTLDWPVPDGARDGLVIVPIGGGDDLRILGETDPSTPLDGLGLVRAIGDRHGLTPREPATWTFDVSKRPLRILVTVVGPEGTAWTCAGSLAVRLHGPTEPLFESTAGCPSPTNVPFLYAEEHTWETGLGDARLAPGAYTVHIDNSLWHGHHAYHTIEWFAR